MLAKAPPPALPTLNFKSPRKVPQTLVPFTTFSKWKTTSRTLTIVGAGYTKRQLETAGAYELIDDETGEKVIVWGDGNDDASVIPSEDVLRWKPPTKRSERTSGGDTWDSSENLNKTKNNPTTTTPGNRVSRKLPAAFGKLKVQRVRNLVRKIPLKNQDDNVREIDEEITEDSYFEPDFFEEDTELGFKKDRKITSRATQSMETRDTVRKVVSGEGVNGGLPGSRLASSSLRGWSQGGSIHDFRDRPEEVPMKWKKSNADNEFFSRKSFRDVGCLDYMIEALRGQNFVRPSHIQALAFGPVIEGKSCIIADQSGSGKTMAYLLPAIQRIRQEELEGLGKSLSQSPRVVVLVPTAELASQVLSNCRSLSKLGVPFRSMVATGGFRQKTQLESLRQELDVLIATPGRFMFLVNEGFLKLTNLKCAVFDEVDILFNDEEFELTLQSLIRSAPVTTQYLFVTATLPVEIYNKLVEDFPDCEAVMGPGMHRTSSGLEEFLVDCSGDDKTEKTPDTAFLNKKSALLRLVEENPVAKTIVFCNKIETCRKVENALKRFDRQGIRVRVLPFHAALEQESRLANMKEFRSSHSDDSSLFLVCTDRASRGIDFAGVDHVVLFDFPRDPSEYVRRVGRTARGAGGIGKAFIFVVGKQVSLARRIIDRNRKGHPLHDVPSAYERMG